MSEPRPAPEEPRDVAAARGIRWDALAAIVASLVGLLALVVAGYTAHIQRQQVSAQVWPYLIGGNSGALSKLVWINKGVGPAIVRNVEVTVGGKPQRDWDAVRDALGLSSFHYNQSFLSGNVLSPGETVEWIRFDGKDDYGNFMHAADRAGMEIAVCYCSTLGECWRTQFGRPERQAVAACPVLPGSRQFHD